MIPRSESFLYIDIFSHQIQLSYALHNSDKPGVGGHVDVACEQQRDDRLHRQLCPRPRHGSHYRR